MLGQRQASLLWNLALGIAFFYIRLLEISYSSIHYYTFILEKDKAIIIFLSVHTFK